jgi:hypothetical protein
MNDINRELAELLGLCWHEFNDNPEQCSKCGKWFRGYYVDSPNPDFTTDPGKIELLRLMEKRADWPEFLWFLWDKEGIQIGVVYKAFISNKGIPHIYITDTTGRLAQAAVEFLRREK